jgi:hypothetical protein
VRSEDLTVTFLGLTLLYAPLPRFAGTELPTFYSEVCKRHQFDSFSLVGDVGALLETESERRLRIEREQLMFEEYIRGSRNSFPLAKQRAMDLVSDATEHFGMRFFLPDDCGIRALWPAPEEIGSIESALRSEAFKLRDDQYEHLGGVSGAGMDLVGHFGEEEDFGWQLELAPYLPEPGNLFLSISAHKHSPLMNAEEVGNFIQQTYDFMTDNVVDFVNSFL